jgi:hypothetical protein
LTGFFLVRSYTHLTSYDLVNPGKLTMNPKNSAWQLRLQILIAIAVAGCAVAWLKAALPAKGGAQGIWVNCSRLVTGHPDAIVNVRIACTPKN